MFCSILILTRNRKKELCKLIASINNLEYPTNGNFEVLVLDNASKDEFKLDNLPQNLKISLRMLFSSSNIGLAAGRNLLAQNAKGEWLFFIDDDAFIPEDDFFLKFISYVKHTNKRLAAVACNIKEYYKLKNYYPFSKRHINRIDLSNPIKCSYFLGGAHFIRREIFLKLGGYDEQLFFWGEELDLSYRLINNGYEIHFNPELLVIHKTSKIKNVDKTTEHFYFLRNKIYINYKYLPWYFRWVSNVVWIAHYIIRTRDIRLVIYAISEAIKLCRGTKRDILNKNTIKYLWKNHGRLFY